MSDSSRDLTIPDANQCMYTACYCEENVWKLCDLTRACQPELLPHCFVAFVSNRRQAVPIWCQKSSSRADGMSVWDYHVIFLYSPPPSRLRPCLIYDLDTTLHFPEEFDTYVREAFRPHVAINPEFVQMFRVVGAAEFLDKFASDRSRMRSSDGSWLKPPPPYPCIRTNSCDNNIDDFISVDEAVGIGKVYTLAQFVQRFS